VGVVRLGDLLIYAITAPQGNPPPLFRTNRMRSSSTESMSREERRAGISLAAIFGLRMLGLFLVLPVFSAGAKLLSGGNDLALVGFALGAYGLTQAMLQIPFGAASDRWGRKPVIIAGLLIYAFGSVVAALAGDIRMLIAGRVLQGAGAISAAVTALAADLTRDHHRTKVMAMIGSSIGLVFALSLVGAPLLYAVMGLSGIFWLTSGLALAAIALLLLVVPAAPPVPRTTGRLREVLADGQLMRLNFGVFALHLMQTAMWVTVPAALAASGGLPTAEQWKVYLPALLVSFAVLVPAVIAAERRDAMKPIFNGAIVLLVVVQGGLYFAGGGLWPIAIWLTLFFISFNVLEATQPSWISRVAPAHAKGMALGVYNTLQSIGLFAGGALGGWIAQHHGAGALRLFCGALGLAWLVLSFGLAAPRRHVPERA
jgi:MFS family permease